MSVRNFWRRIAGRVLLCALGLALLACGSVGGTTVAHHDNPPLASPWLTPTPVPVVPTRLLVPALQIDAPIELVGLTSGGDLATPARSPWVDTGWYRGGPLPGALGSAVIDGHLDQPGGSPAVFWLLNQLLVGDLVQVRLSSGQTLSFRVTEVAYYRPLEAPLQRIFADRSGHYLNLITCAGDWIESQHQTTLRLVIYTSLVATSVFS